RDPQPVARAPRVCAQRQRRGRRDVAVDELPAPLEAPGREDRRLVARRLEAHVAGRSDERLREAAWIEANAGRQRVARLLPHDRSPQRAQPLETVVDPVEHEPLQLRIAARTLAPEL